MKDTVFQSIMKPITPELISNCLKEYNSDYGYEHLNTYNHLFIMIYAHLGGLKSLRTLETTINSGEHGLNMRVCRSTLSDANKNRPAECFLWILTHLMTVIPQKLCSSLNKIVRILDSSPIQLKSRGYEWSKAHATRRCQGLKLHAEYDLEVASPTNIALSYANYNDSSMARRWPIVKDTVYIFDKGYYDFNWWWNIHQEQAFFVTRLKKNVSILEENRAEVSGEEILEDSTFHFKNKNPRGGKRNSYSNPLRKVSVIRENKTPLILVTNLMDTPAEEIARLYKARWDIELFFKWIKQNLKIKKFLGKSENAVKIQLITAIIAYLLTQIYKAKFNDSRKLYLILAWIKINLNLKSKIGLNKYAPPQYNFNQSIKLIRIEGKLCSDG